MILTTIYKSGEILKTDNNTVALGTFDGLHLAHMEIIKKAMQISKENKTKCGVMFFDSLPVNSFGGNVKHLMNTAEKIEILDTDFVYVESFNESFYNKSPEEFVEYLKTTLKAGYVCVGYNYRFGKNASGDVDTLKKLCFDYGINVEIQPELCENGDVVSSTRIRKCIADGNVKEAEILLGRPYCIRGIVERGLQNGRKFGIPTANISYENGKMLPESGVYAGYVMVNDKKYKSVINVGNNPTFDGSRITVEPHIIDFDRDIYGEEITAMFIDRIRGEIRFSSVNELVKQINKDIDKCRKDLSL